MIMNFLTLEVLSLAELLHITVGTLLQYVLRTLEFRTLKGFGLNLLENLIDSCKASVLDALEPLLISTSTCLSGLALLYRVPSYAMLLGLACARLRRAALILPGVTGTKELGSHHHCVRGRCSLGLAVQLVMLIGADIRAVYRAEVLCVAAHHLQQ